MDYIKLSKYWHLIAEMTSVSGMCANILSCMCTPLIGTKVAQLLMNVYHSVNSIAGRFYPHYLVIYKINKYVCSKMFTM